MRTEAKFIHFHSRKFIWKCRQEIGGHFVSASMPQLPWRHSGGQSTKILPLSWPNLPSMKDLVKAPPRHHCYQCVQIIILSSKTVTWNRIIMPRVKIWVLLFSFFSSSLSTWWQMNAMWCHNKWITLCSNGVNKNTIIIICPSLRCTKSYDAFQ